MWGGRRVQGRDHHCGVGDGAVGCEGPFPVGSGSFAGHSRRHGRDPPQAEVHKFWVVALWPAE
eukprot:4610781-Lingulodinium_polyedra.AAC.1